MYLLNERGRCFVCGRETAPWMLHCPYCGERVLVRPAWRRAQVAVTLMPILWLAALISLYGVDFPACIRGVAQAPPWLAGIILIPLLALLAPPDGKRLPIASRGEQIRWMVLILAGRLGLLAVLALSAAALAAAPRLLAPFPIAALIGILIPCSLWFRFWGLR